MIKLNARLIKQSGEKDEMNAKSLSTILQLKEIAEKFQEEKSLLEQEMKSAGQVNLASRLASNARDRVTEEALKEKEQLQSKITKLEQECESLKQGKQDAVSSLEKHKAEMSNLETAASTAKDRCDELVNKTEEQEKEKRRVMESCAVAQREAAEAATHMAKMKANTKGGSSIFTTDQLETQIQHLKSRVACPVCNHRDKTCILLRCRHMFCKSCVDENIRNRSRKCPACKQPFDKKDIADVWL